MSEGEKPKINPDALRRLKARLETGQVPLVSDKAITELAQKDAKATQEIEAASAGASGTEKGGDQPAPETPPQEPD